MDLKRKASKEDLPTFNGLSQDAWVMTEKILETPPITPHDNKYSPRDMSGCPEWSSNTPKQWAADPPRVKRIKPDSYYTSVISSVPDDSDSTLYSASALDLSPWLSDFSDNHSRSRHQALLPSSMPSPVDFSSFEQVATGKMKRGRLRDSVEGDRNYVDDQNSDDNEDGDSPAVIDRSERDDIIFILSREKAKRMAQAIKVPEDTRMGEEEKSLYLNLATRGCYPVLPSDWKKDFATLPESLFPSGDDEVDESDFAFAVQNGSEFYAITALHEILKLPGRVRDCKLLEVHPQDVIKKAIRRYLRWAIADAGLKKRPGAKRVYTIVTQWRDKDGKTEDTLNTVKKVLNKLDECAIEHKRLYENTPDPYWPTLVGFCLCGPIVTILSIDTDPKSATWKEENACRAKYMGQFDMSEDDQDVWNSLALAIAVIHIRQTMTRLADHYPGKDGVAQRRRPGDATDDEDL